MSFTGPNLCRRARFETEHQAAGVASAVGAPYRARHCAACGHWHIVSDERPAFRLHAPLGRAVVRGAKTTHRIPVGRVRSCPYRIYDGEIDNGRPRGIYRLEYEQQLANDVGDAILTSDGTARVTYTTETLVLVTKIEREPLEAIDDDKATAEGFASFAEFLDYWHNTYGELTDRRMAGEVWVVHFVVEHEDTIRLLANELRAGSAYTSTANSALPHEPEAIDPDIVAQLPSSQDARHRWELAKLEHDADFRALPLEDQVAAIRQLAERTGADVRGPLREIARQVQRARRRLPDAA